MGTRAIVVFANGNNTAFSPMIYLHWNGGPESIYAFLAELDRREVRHDLEYEAARFVQIVGQFFDQEYFTTLSLGIMNSPATYEEIKEQNPTDNGIYLFCRELGQMQRFTYKGEMSLEDIAAERKEALEHPYSESIRQVFLDMNKPLERERYDQKSARILSVGAVSA